MADVDATNGFHASSDSLKKRKSQSSPISDNHESPPISVESKRPKLSDMPEGSSPQQNTEVTQAEFNEMLSKVIQVIQGLDKDNILTMATLPLTNGEHSAITIKSIQTKLKEGEYSSTSALKDDFTRLCNSATMDHRFTTEQREHAKKLLRLATDLIGDKSHYSIRSHGKKALSKEEDQTARPERDYENIALFQRGTEGNFVFSSKAIIKDDTLDKDLAKSIIVPIASSSEPPLIKDVNTKPRTQPRAADQSKKKNSGVEYCVYSPFTSFAPFVDSSNAELNAEDTATAYSALLDKYSQKVASAVVKPEETETVKAQLNSVLEIADQYRQQENAAAISEADLAFLSKEGLDVASLAQATARSSITKTSLSPVEAIQQNAILLFELHKLQEERFSSKSQTITAREHDLAAQLQNSLISLTSQIPSSKLVSPQAIEETIRKLPYKDAAFVGTLPPNKPFAFPTNIARGSLPATATGYPLHSPVALRKTAAPTTIFPQVALSPHLNMTGGYPSVPQSHQYHYTAPQQPTHQKTYSRPRTNLAPTTAAPLQVSANGDITFRKNLHTVVTIGGTPSHWRRNDSQTPCANCGTLVSPIWRLGVRNEKLCNACGQYNKKWNGQHRPISLFPNTEVPTFRK
ncbi:hypothetical protein EMPS_09559 [Entomortierella parvispora]|uniref:GATA-type domain-containing protein n=1 Tax=Entomortierella parvispora TaxID=205924 RepID=A0A9P3M0Q1_9FUNG|nr:hypothetical protein EMPS_09559 [Entomortierella parvispora]